MPNNYSTSFTSWPDCTFTWESEDQDYRSGSHWDPFYESVDSVLNELPTIIGNSRNIVSYSDTRPAPREVPTKWPKGVHLCWPNNNRGLITTLFLNKEGNEIVNLYPFTSYGTQANIEIERVFLLNSGAETIIEGSWGESSIAFFDIFFFSNCAWYKAGETYDFILSGVAYEVKPADVKAPIPGIIETSAVNIEGAAMFTPITEWNRDDYWFRGSVLKVESFSKETFNDMLGQSGWQIKVKVMRFLDEDLEDAELEIIVTQRAWSGSEPPKIGQDVEGQLWLQGYLWFPHPPGYL